MDDIASKSVTWRIPTRETLRTRSSGRARVKSAHATRDQPTWFNCKQGRPAVEKQQKRRRIKSAPSVVFSQSNRSSYSCYTIVENTESSESSRNLCSEARGRECLRRRAKEVLSPILATKYQNFDAADLNLDTNARAPSGGSRGFVKFSETAKKIVAHRDTGGQERYFINGVSSRSYRRPSIQMNIELLTENGGENNIESQQRRYSVPVLPSEASKRRLSVVSSVARSELSSTSASTSAPATIASNDEPKVVRTATGPAPAYLERDWNSDLLTRYALHRPWLPKYLTTRYFPKRLNLQDVHCRNPYIVPGSFLYNSTVS